MKKLIMTAACFLCSLFMYTATVEAASLKSTYELKSGSHFSAQRLEIKGGQTKTITVKVKESGTFKLASKNDNYDNLKLKGKEEIKLRILDAKGKTLTTKYVKKNNRVYYSAALKKGTYRIVMSTKNVKKNTKRTFNLGVSFNKSLVLKADNKKVYDIVNTKSSTKVKFINDQAQTVIIRCDGPEMEEGVIKVTDSKGNTVFTDIYNNDQRWYCHYLSKGTYDITFSGDSSVIHAFSVKVLKSYSTNVKGTATSKDKAVNYTGATINLGYMNPSQKEKIQWVKVDTTQQDYAFLINYTIDRSIVYAVPDPLEDVIVYKEDGTKVVMEQMGRYTFAKGSGIYYISIPTKSSEVVVIDPREVKAAVITETERTVITYNQTTKLPVREQQVTGSFEVMQDSYGKIEVDENGKKTGVTLFDDKNNKVKADVDGISKLKSGTYTFAKTVLGKDENYDCEITIYPIKDMKKEGMAYTSGKKVTVNLTGLKADKVYQFCAWSAVYGGNAKVAIYEDGKKMVEKADSCYFTTKAKKSYKAVITSSSDRLLYYSNYYLASFKEANKDLKSTKKSAKTFVASAKSNVYKDFKIKGKTSGWIKLKSTSKEKMSISLAGYGNGGEVVVKVYDSKGKLKKTLRLKDTLDFAWYEVAGNQTYFIHISSTNNQTYVNAKLTAYGKIAS